MTMPLDLARTALLIIDLQNDFLHPDGAYGRAGQSAEAVAAPPETPFPTSSPVVVPPAGSPGRILRAISPATAF